MASMEELELRARKFLLRLASVPGDPNEARAFVQRRTRIYFGVLLGIWLGVFLLDRIVTLAFTGQLFWSEHKSTAFHVAITVIVSGAFAFSARGERSMVTLGFVELFVTFSQSLLLSLMFAQVPLRNRPDLLMVLGLTHVLVLRAAIMPSTPRGATGIALLTGTPVLAISAYLHTLVPHEPGTPPSVLLTVNIATWLLITIAGTSAMSSIIWGLQERMRAAMKLGQYTLSEKIGEGGMGVVYRAKHALLRRPTAVKVLGASKEADQALITRFEREVQLTSEIAHPNIVSVYDFGRSPDGSFYYAMEFLEGIDLQRLVRADGPVPPARVAYILQQTADALAEAHSVGLIHRDIKPATIVLCRHERRPDHVKVVDFGLVKQIGTDDPALSGANTITGTPLYMPPEQLLSPNEIDGRSDLYSLGAVAYFLLTGEPVFAGTTLLEVCAQTLHEPVVPPSKRAKITVPPKLEALVLTCLAKKKDDRPANADAFIAALRACDDVPTWTPAEATAWWKTRADQAMKKTAEHDERTPFTRTLAIAPRSDEAAE